jgi:hypothetical protein
MPIVASPPNVHFGALQTLTRVLNSALLVLRPHARVIASRRDYMNPGAAIAVGVGMGTALGVAMHNLAFGVGIGVALGAGLATISRKRGN